MISKTLVYKIARFSPAQDASLQTLLRQALRQNRIAMSRRQQTEVESQHRLINHHIAFQNMRVGEFFEYTGGYRQPTARLDVEAAELTLATVTPPDRFTEFLQSILYFGVYRNHVVLSQSTALRALQFEAYVNWLLHETGQLEDEHHVALADQPPLDETAQISRTTGIEFKSPVATRQRPAPRVRDHAREIVIQPTGNVWQALQSLLPPELTLPTRIESSDLARNRELELTLRLKWSSQSAKDSTDLLDGIADQLRHIDEEIDYKIFTKSGTITRDEIKLRKPIAVQTNIDGLVRRESMWDHMRNWLRELLEERRIEGDA